MASEWAETYQRLRKRPRALDKRAIRLAKESEWRRITKYVRERDGVCRLCKKPGHEVHHVEFRSRGGKDVASNAVLLCKKCHTDVHAHLIKLTGDAQKKRGLMVGRYCEAIGDYTWKEA